MLLSLNRAARKTTLTTQTYKASTRGSDISRVFWDKAAMEGKDMKTSLGSQNLRAKGFTEFTVTASNLQCYG